MLPLFSLYFATCGPCTSLLSLPRILVVYDTDAYRTTRARRRPETHGPRTDQHLQGAYPPGHQPTYTSRRIKKKKKKKQALTDYTRRCGLFQQRPTHHHMSSNFRHSPTSSLQPTNTFKTLIPLATNQHLQDVHPPFTNTFKHLRLRLRLVVFY